MKKIQWKIYQVYKQKIERGREKKIKNKHKSLNYWGFSLERYTWIETGLCDLPKFTTALFFCSRIQKHRPLQGKDSGDLNDTVKAPDTLFNHIINLQPQAKQSTVQIPN